MIGLTPRQQQCLDFIKATIDARGLPPSYEEIAAALHLDSKSGVQRLVNGLADRGRIRRMPRRARAIEVIEPESLRAVMLSQEVFHLARAYAESQRISVDCAVSEIVREALGAA